MAKKQTPQDKQNEIQKSLGNLPKTVRSATVLALPRAARLWRRSIRRLIPVDTGKLKQEFNLTFDIRREVLNVDYGKAGEGGEDYGRAVERGFQGHYIPIEFIERHREGDPNPSRWVQEPREFVFVSKPEKSHFLVPGLQLGSPSVNRFIQNRVADAIRKELK